MVNSSLYSLEKVSICHLLWPGHVKHYSFAPKWLDLLNNCYLDSLSFISTILCHRILQFKWSCRESEWNGLPHTHIYIWWSIDHTSIKATDPGGYNTPTLCTIVCMFIFFRSLSLSHLCIVVMISLIVVQHRHHPGTSSPHHTKPSPQNKKQHSPFIGLYIYIYLCVCINMCLVSSVKSEHERQTTLWKHRSVCGAFHSSFTLWSTIWEWTCNRGHTRVDG